MSKSNDSTNPTSSDDWQSDSKLFADLVAHGMSEGVRRAIAEHHRLGYAVPISRDGKIVMWHPDGSYRPVEQKDAEADASPGEEPPLGEE